MERLRTPKGGKIIPKRDISQTWPWLMEPLRFPNPPPKEGLPMEKVP